MQIKSSDSGIISSQYSSSFHHHLLTTRVYLAWKCSYCGNRGGIFYECKECGFTIHSDCAERLFQRPFLCNHYPKIFVGDKDLRRRCHCCGDSLDELFAACTICNISMNLNCVKDPLPRTIFQPKHHKHSLTILPRLVIFTCNACGLEGDGNPYVCLECNFMVHKDCIDLPRVILINRHDHRISHTFHLGQEKEGLECGVCRKTIDWVYGAFQCSKCPTYTVHSKCATRKEVWDGIELEDVPEEEEKIEDPYEVINETDIIHFSHEEHVLRLLDETCVTTTDHMRCDGCVLPIIKNEQGYKCVECDFILHKECASLPRKKHHFLHNHKLTLLVDEKSFECRACETVSNGFRYKCEEGCGSNDVYDVRCSSVSEPFQHDLHPHPLYWTLEDTKVCEACGVKTVEPLSCTVCEYHLCMACATLPRKVKNLRYDDHFLTLSQGIGNSSGDLWCDVCETKTDPSVCYYTCDECGVTLHKYCLLGAFYYSKVGSTSDGSQVVANNRATRPLCINCEDHCKSSFFVKAGQEDFAFYYGCLDNFMWWQRRPLAFWC